MSIANADKNLLYIPENLRKTLPEYKYNFDISVIENPLSVYSIVSKHITPNSKVLDVGCSTGYLGSYLADVKNCTVYGIDIDRKSLLKAEETGKYIALECVNLDNKEDLEILQKKFPEDFDYILILDVLEHLKDPSIAFLSLLQHLKENGKLIVSIPNINHIDVVFNLINGRFNYSTLGILDNTHLRFFTKSSFEEWINSLSEDLNFSLKMEIIGRTTSETINVPENQKRNLLKQMNLLKKLYKLSNREEEMFTVQYIFSIEKVN